MYDYYKTARDTAWKVLTECKITSLPVDLTVVADHYNIKYVRYSKSPLTQLFKPEVLSGDGFIAEIKSQKTIFLNDTIKTRGRRRFTFGHELGHGILGHPLDKIVYRNSEIDNNASPLEMQANVFSRGILAPACVLHGLGVATVEEIMRFCDISRVSAEIRLERLELLRRRGAFFTSRLEKKVFDLFYSFINEHKKVGL